MSARLRGNGKNGVTKGGGEEKVKEKVKERGRQEKGKERGWDGGDENR